MSKTDQQQAVEPFVLEGTTEVENGNIKIPLNYKGPRKITPMEYQLHGIRECEQDYFPHCDGICLFGAIHVTQKIAVPVAFKAIGEKSPYKILIN